MVQMTLGTRQFAGSRIPTPGDPPILPGHISLILPTNQGVCMATLGMILNVISAATAFVAASFWYLSARNELPKMRTYWDSTPSTDPFFVAIRKGVILNRQAAAYAAASAICATLATAVSLVSSNQAMP